MSPEAVISALGLKRSALVALERAGLPRVKDVIRCTEEELQKFGIKEKALVDVVDALAFHHLSLRVEESAADSETTELSTVTPLAVATLSTEPEWLQEPLPRTPQLDGADEAVSFAEEIFGSGASKRVRKATTVTDSDRAHRYAARHAARKSLGPRLDDPEDVERLRVLRATTTLTPEETAWMYGVSKDVVYRELQSGRLAHKKFGNHYKVPTCQVFSELLPDWPTPIIEALP